MQLEYLANRFQRRVLEALLEEKLLAQETVGNMLSWENSGFHVFVGKPIEHADEEARLFVARYLKKSPISLKRLELIESGPELIVRYHSFKSELPEHRDFTLLEFLAELSQHLPDTFEQTTRYMEVLSARTRGAKRINSPPATLELEPAPKASKCCLSPEAFPAWH